MTARLILCERTGRWAAALRIELAAAELRVWEAGPLEEPRRLLAQWPASFLVAELTEKSGAHLIRQLGQIDRFWPQTRVAVVADRKLAGWEWLMREAGAVHFVTSPRELSPLVDLACRHLAAAPAPPQSFTERIWAGLPWKG